MFCTEQLAAHPARQLCRGDSWGPFGKSCSQQRKQEFPDLSVCKPVCKPVCNQFVTRFATSDFFIDICFVLRSSRHTRDGNTVAHGQLGSQLGTHGPVPRPGGGVTHWFSRYFDQFVKCCSSLGQDCASSSLRTFFKVRNSDPP